MATLVRVRTKAASCGSMRVSDGSERYVPSGDNASSRAKNSASEVWVLGAITSDNERFDRYGQPEYALDLLFSRPAP